MGFPVAVDGCELEDVTGGGTVSVDSSPSDQVFADGKGVFFGTINISVSGSDGGGKFTDKNGAGSGTLTGTGTNVCDADGQPAVLEDDSATVVVNGTSSGYTQPPATITIKVKNAGQDKVIAL